MITQPKTKHEFERHLWSFIGRFRHDNPTTNEFYKWFYKLPFPFQQGVYQDYFRSVGIQIEVRYNFNGYYSDLVMLVATRQLITTGNFDNHSTALLAALNAAADLREEQLVNNIP